MRGQMAPIDKLPNAELCDMFDNCSKFLWSNMTLDSFRNQFCESRRIGSCFAFIARPTTLGLLVLLHDQLDVKMYGCTNGGKNASRLRQVQRCFARPSTTAGCKDTAAESGPTASLQDLL
jgi:hypothetical protein